MADLDPARLGAFVAICQDLGLAIPAISTARKNLIDAKHGAAHLAYLLPHIAKLAYQAEDLQPVAALAMDEFLVWVKADAPYKTIGDLIEAGKATPGKIAFGGSQSKDTDETLVALIEQTSGADFKYVPFNGGGEVGGRPYRGQCEQPQRKPGPVAGRGHAPALRLCAAAHGEKRADP